VTFAPALDAFVGDAVDAGVPLFERDPLGTPIASPHHAADASSCSLPARRDRVCCSGRSEADRERCDAYDGLDCGIVQLTNRVSGFCCCADINVSAIRWRPFKDS
jgi:hypothetical protein